MVLKANDRSNLLYIDDAIRGQDTPNKSMDNSVNPTTGAACDSKNNQRKSGRRSNSRMDTDDRRNKDKDGK